MGVRAGTRGIYFMKHGFPWKSVNSGTRMGVETPMPPVVMNAAAPGGAPPRRIQLHGWER